MKAKKRRYLGNWPNSPTYDESLPIGYIKWDEEEDDIEDIDEGDLQLENNSEWDAE